jgi:stage II sporulation protein AA (anti-sigma F factor antagonist)
LDRFWTIVQFDEQRFLLRVTGDEDRASQSLRRRDLSRAITTCRSDLRVDLSDLVFADSSLMLDLAMLARRLRHAGGKLVLCDPQPHIRRLIEVVGLDRLPGVLMASPAH